MSYPQPVENEVMFEDGVMITETDLEGHITYANRKFIQMSAYEKDELLGQPHSIMRHPDMPKCCFKDMWETVKKGDTWKGYVKNLRKDGAYYWVVSYVSPKVDDDGNMLGYIAVRKVPEPKTIEEMKSRYQEMVYKEARGDTIPTEFIGNLILGEVN